jgi:uracil-DNA glycosylase family protein
MAEADDEGRDVDDDPEHPHGAEDFLPQRRTLESLREAATHCRGCELYEHASQCVFGAGQREARLVLLGEMPGDREDREGQPFVGPAGRLLDQALDEAGLDRRLGYITNAVKHFRFAMQRGRRVHKSPTAKHLSACKPWLEAELGIVKPRRLLCLGASAARSMLGSDASVAALRGSLHPHPLVDEVQVTIHPSALLRIRRRPEEFRVAYQGFIDDLRDARAAIMAD